jgi:hypothetical protein
MSSKKFNRYVAIVMRDGVVVGRYEYVSGIKYGACKGMAIDYLRRFIDGAYGRIEYKLSLRGMDYVDTRTEHEIKVGFSPTMVWVDSDEVFSL